MSNQPMSKLRMRTPSLPNLRLPPHSGPIPNHLQKAYDAILQRPSSPKPGPTTTSPEQVLHQMKSDTHRHVKYASLDPASNTKSRHRRLEHSLLTPPLTPSSSIRTNASDSAADSINDRQVESKGDEKEHVADDDTNPTVASDEISDEDTSASRIILFEGMKKDIEPPILEAVIFEALAAAAARAKANGTALPFPPLRREELVTKGMNKRDLATEGRVPVIFYDLRVAKVVNDLVQNGTDGLNESLGEDGHLKASMVSIEDLTKTFGVSPLLSSADGIFFLRVQNAAQKQSEGTANPPTTTFHETASNFRGSIKSAFVTQHLKSFGPLRNFVFQDQEGTSREPTALVYRVEFHSTRHAEVAYKQLKSYEYLGIILDAFGKVQARQPSASAIDFPSISSPTEISQLPVVTEVATQPRQLLYATESHPRLPPQDCQPLLEQSANPCVGTSSLCCSPDGACYYYPSKPNSPPLAVPYFQYPASPTPPVHYYGFPPPAGFEYPNTFTHAPPPWVVGYDPTIASMSPPLHGTNMVGMPNPLNRGYYQHYPQTQSSSPADGSGARPTTALLGVPRPSSSPPTSGQAGNYLEHSAPVHPSNDRNQLNIARIEEGNDTRTTIMLKNIPNKMSDQNLTEFINAVCPRRVDFLYLRMDFTNGCNVGYAFVNFIRVEDLLRFAKAKLGVKWNMFSSEKVLQMSYANYQGKEALVEKFKNSAIMDEKPAWRPRIFYSSGPDEGLSEPFPAPTHMRRKERSSYNRGALYVPGTGTEGGLHHPRGNPHRRYLEDNRGNGNGFGRRLEGAMSSGDVSGRRSAFHKTSSR